jgi:hypothetical protein
LFTALKGSKLGWVPSRQHNAVKATSLSKLYIAVAHNPQNNYALLHKPLVALNASIRQCESCTYELLDSLRTAGASDEEVNLSQREIEEKGQTTFEAVGLTDAVLEDVVSKCCAPPACY